ncbi:MAG: L-threonine 3-dehydrogenase [Candidatus Undinarchaeales archaeon]|jgi:threonine 3-dehydrogenase|nr:L-threonine 3-dehydrogenase [Candidatus Undinarchaeales archaeon]
MEGKMRAVMKVRPEYDGTEIVEVDIPKPGPTEVLIRNKCVSICGTDVHIFDWDPWAQGRIKTPLIYGHEFAGEIVEVGSAVTSVKVGDQVSGECHIVDNRCEMCQSGRAHICDNVEIFGVDRTGIFAEYCCIPAFNVWVNDPTLPPEFCSVQDPLGNAVHTVFSTNVSGQSVAILGAGPIGLMATAVCKVCGASEIYVVEGNNKYRAKLARKVGAYKTFLASEQDVEKEILERTNGAGVDVVLEMSGNAHAFNTGLRILKKGGHFAILGVYKEPIPIDITDMVVFKGITMVGITGRHMFKTWQITKNLLNIPSLCEDLSTIITHNMPFEDFKKGMEIMRSGQSGKVVLSLE